ncbi:MAG: PAS domain-containing sensor histidine kinase, partial [Thermodesulfobacteriota bacterium]
MFRFFSHIRSSLAFKLIFIVGATLLVCIAIWAYFNINYQQERYMDRIVTEAVRLGKTIKLGTHYAMMNNARNDINQIITNIARQKEIESLRIYNKAGQIKFSNNTEEVDRITNIRDEACNVCHDVDPPRHQLPVEKRTRLFTGPDGERKIGIITPVRNEAGCAGQGCHVSPKKKKILGALDTVMSLSRAEKEILRFEKGVIFLAVFTFLAAAGLIFVGMMWFVNRPIQRLIGKTRAIASG